MTYAEEIDAVLDLWDGAYPGFDEFTADEIAGQLSVPRDKASRMLVMHRRAQRRGATRWIANSRSYGPAASWYIVGGPGRASGTAERLSLGHAAHVANDLRRRAMSDLACELRPAAAAHPAVQALVAGMAKQIEVTVIGLVDTINVVLDTIESTTGIPADRRGVTT